MKRIISIFLSLLLVVNTTTFIYANDEVPTVEETTYSFSIEEVEGGTVSVEEDEDNLYIPDTELYFNVEPDDGYVLEDIYAVSKDNEDIKYELTLVEGKYLLVMPNDNVSIIPVFTKEVKEETIEEEILPEETETVVENPPLDSAVIPEVDVEPQSEEPDYQTGYIQDNIPARSIYDENYGYSNKGVVASNTIPSSYSSLDKGVITSVKNQNPFSTCWAYATIAASEASLVATGKETVSNADLSERHLTYFSYHSADDPLGNQNDTYNLASKASFGSSGDGGNDPYLFSGAPVFLVSQTLASWKGITYENAIAGPKGTNSETFLSEYNKALSKINGQNNNEIMNDFYNNTSIDSKNAFSKDAYHLKNYFSISIKDMNDVKKAIMKYGAGTVEIYTKAFQGYGSYPLTITNYFNAESSEIDHLVTVIGWDDNYDKNKFGNYINNERISPKNNGAWLIKNSWGTNYSYLGPNGYFWISYEDLCFQREFSKVWFYEYDRADNYDNNYQYDGSGAWYYNHLQSGGSISNVFKASSNEYLEAVGITLNSDVNVDYSIQIYTDLKDPTNPTSGTSMLSKPKTGKTTYAGFYTVDLGEKISLKKGQDFSVVITLSHKNGSEIFYEVDRQDFSLDYAKFYHKVQANRSFEKDTVTSEWEDLSGVANESGDESYCTARIKAFTSNSRTSIKNVTVSGISNKTYTGKAITQKPTVKLNDVTLVEGKDYTLTYKNNTNVGTATITITGKGNYTDTVSKTFNINANTKIKLNKSSATIGTKKVGKYTNTLQLKATVTGHNNTKVTWTSSNPKIAKVDKNGKVTAVSDPNYKGSSVTITAKTVDGKTATCKVTVEDPINAFVRRLYKYCLNRNPDKGGFDFWTSRLRSKKITAAEAVKGFFDSKEMKDMKLSNAETIERCYLAMMDRKSDKGGKEYWIKNFKKYGKIYVLKGFVNSQEFTKICKDFNITKGSIK